MLRPPSPIAAQSARGIALLFWLAPASGLASCGAPSLQWPGRAPEDPDPSGPRYLRFYKDSHFRELGDHFVGGVTDAMFDKELAASRVLYLGDHHHDHDLHARMLALLSELHARGHRLRLGLECIGSEDAPALDAYLAGQTSLADLAEQARRRWPDSWLTTDRVDAAFYRELLRRARANGWPAFALEPTPRLSLYERDQVIAASIHAEATRHPDDLVVVIVGHTHLLGEGRLVSRVGLPNCAIVPRLSVSLAAAGAMHAWQPDQRFARASSGVLFTLPLDTHPDEAEDG